MKYEVDLKAYLKQVADDKANDMYKSWLYRNEEDIEDLRDTLKMTAENGKYSYDLDCLDYNEEDIEFFKKWLELHNLPYKQNKFLLHIHWD